ncbi:MAG: extracellular solute-binding protein [Chloroflexi bacterium]|nr:extracellular solute-binding protein [Chloroflexota bacterium]
MSSATTRRQFLSFTAASSAALMAATLLAACGSTATSATAATVSSSTAPAKSAATTSTTAKAAAKAAAAPPKVAKQVTKIHVWWDTTPSQQAVAADFEKANPDIKVQLGLMGQNVYGSPKYLAAVAAGTGPDVSFQNRNLFPEYSSLGLFKDITSLYEREGFTQSDIFPEQWKELTWGGKLYGIPYNVDGRFFFWNMQHFEEVGLDPKVGPKTWTDLEKFTAKLTLKKGNTFERYGFIPEFPALSDQLLIFALEDGAKVWDASGKKLLFTEDPAWADALTWVKHFYDVYDGGAHKAAQWLSGFAGQALDPFAQGKISMTSYGLWMVGGYAAYPNLKYNGSYAMPVADKLAGRTVNWSCDFSFVIDPHTKHEAESWKFIMFVTGKPGVSSVATTGLTLTKQQWAREKLPGTPVYVPVPMGLAPVNTWLRNSPYVQKLPEPQRSMALSGFDGIKWATGCGVVGWLVGAELWTGFKNAWDMVMIGNKTPQDALASVTPPIQTALDKAWARIARAHGA